MKRLRTLYFYISNMIFYIAITDRRLNLCEDFADDHLLLFISFFANLSIFLIILSFVAKKLYKYNILLVCLYLCLLWSFLSARMTTSKANTKTETEIKPIVVTYVISCQLLIKITKTLSLLIM